MSGPGFRPAAEQLALVAKRVNEGGAKGAHFHISKDIDLSGDGIGC